MDALIHAIEAFTSVNSYDLTDHLALRAIHLIFNNLRTAYSQGKDLDARSQMLEGSLLAGMAFANAGVTAVHAFAYPLGGEFKIPHGVANSVMAPYVLRFNLTGNLTKFAKNASVMGLSNKDMGEEQTAQGVVLAIEQLVRDLQIPPRLRDLSIPKDALPRMAEAVLNVTRLLANNPRRIEFADAQQIYLNAW
jgi:alcohol dehydrogenase class IV